MLSAFHELNRAGGVKGRQLRLVSRDDVYGPAQSISATRHLIEQDKVFALVGAVGTPTSMATLPLAAEAKLPFIGTFSGADFLRDPMHTHVINVRASYAQELNLLVTRMIADRGAQRFAILYQDDAFGRSGLEALQAALATHGLRLVAEGTFERNTTAVKRGLFEIRSANPDAIILLGPPAPCAAFIRLAKQLRMAALVAGISFSGGALLAELLGPDGAGVYLTQVVPSPEAGGALADRFRAAMQFVDAAEATNIVAFEGYIAGRLIIDALASAEKIPTRAALLDILSNSSFDLDGFKLSYHGVRNQGSDVVYLTRLAGDGRVAIVSSMIESPASSAAMNGPADMTQNGAP